MIKQVGMKGEKFGRLIVVESAGVGKDRHIIWKCKCDCGNEIIVKGTSLRNGITRSCGCLIREGASEMGKRNVGENHPMYGKYGKDSTRWKGGRVTTTEGYIRVMKKDHPRGDAKGYVFEHILVMEKMLGRPLVNGEVVHHCNGNTADNQPYNLRLFPDNAEHTRYHAKLRKEGEDG